MFKRIEPHVWYKIPIGQIAFGPLTHGQLCEIFSNGRVGYLFTEAFIAACFGQVSQVGDGAGKDLVQYGRGAPDPFTFSIQAKGFHSKKKDADEVKWPDVPTISTVSSADFEARKDLTVENAVHYCREYDYFIYHDLDAVNWGNVEFVMLPAGVVARAVELSFHFKKRNGTGIRKSSAGCVSLDFIRYHVKETAVLNDNHSYTKKETEDGKGAVLYSTGSC